MQEDSHKFVTSLSMFLMTGIMQWNGADKNIDQGKIYRSCYMYHLPHGSGSTVLTATGFANEKPYFDPLPRACPCGRLAKPLDRCACGPGFTPRGAPAGRSAS